VLDEALVIRAFEMLELLLKWGAEPTKVSTENVVDTYTTGLIDRFWIAGVDYTVDPAFVTYLAHTVNKPRYGWLRRNRPDHQRLQDALDMALHKAVADDREVPIHLLVWAGADPHRSVPSDCDVNDREAWGEEEYLSSAAETAILYGRSRFFDILRVSTMPDIAEQAVRAARADSSTLKKIVGLRVPDDWSQIILALIWRASGRFSKSSWDVQDSLRFVESSGGKLSKIESDQLRYVRSQLLDMASSDEFLWLLKWLRKPKNCEPAIFDELTRTTAMRKKVEALNAGARYLTPSQKMSRANEKRARTARKQQTQSASSARES
jgi:hypothetical protein